MHDQERSESMNALIHILAKSGLLTKDLDYHLIRASMVLIFLAFGYQKWWAYEAQVLIPYISNGPLIFWMYPVFGFIAPCLPSRAPRPPYGAFWLHEIKHDGFRAIARKDGVRVKIYSRPRQRAHPSLPAAGRGTRSPNQSRS
jgi:Protein of unknown function, DUF417